MDIFGNTTKMRGCYIKFFANSAGGGAAISGIKIKDSLVLSVDYLQREKVNVVQCFGDSNYVYAFGHDPVGSVLNITLLGFLAGQKGGGSSVFNDANRAYKTKRVSKSKSQVTVTVGSNKVGKGFVIAMQSRTQNQEYNLQTFTYTLLMPEPS